jgi:hypothetical protein
MYLNCMLYTFDGLDSLVFTIRSEPSARLGTLGGAGKWSMTMMRSRVRAVGYIYAHPSLPAR